LYTASYTVPCVPQCEPVPGVPPGGDAGHGTLPRQIPRPWGGQGQATHRAHDRWIICAKNQRTTTVSQGLVIFTLKVIPTHKTPHH